MQKTEYKNTNSVYSIFINNETTKFINDTNTSIIHLQNLQLHEEIKQDETLIFEESSNIHIINPFLKKHFSYEHPFKYLFEFLLSKATTKILNITVYTLENDDLRLLDCFISFIKYQFNCEIELIKNDKLEIILNNEKIYALSI